jgi:hypothetical protein
MPARQLPITGFAHKTGIIGDPGMLTVRAPFDMTATLGRSANLDRLHHAPLNPVDVASIGTAPGLAVAAEDVCYFQFRPEHAPIPHSFRSHRPSFFENETAPPSAALGVRPGGANPPPGRLRDPRPPVGRRRAHVKGASAGRAEPSLPFFKTGRGCPMTR